MADISDTQSDRWLDQGNRRNILWAFIGVIGTPFLLAFLYAFFLFIVFLGAWLGIWHLNIESR